MDGWIGGWMVGLVDGWMDGWIGGWMDVLIGGWKDGWKDGRMSCYPTRCIFLNSGTNGKIWKKEVQRK